MIVIDCEVYTNYFLLSALHIETGRIRHFESLNDSPLDTNALGAMLRNDTSVSFNGNNFDLPIIAHALAGATNKQTKALCDKIIKSNLPAWRIAADAGIKVPGSWDHIDIIDVAPGKSSLKIYGGRLHCKTLQDLPLQPSATITKDDSDQLRAYCENDLQTTLALYYALEQQIELRRKMSGQYGMDLRSKSDAQIAETIILSELHTLTGKKQQRTEIADGHAFRYLDPGIVEFKSEQLRIMFNRLLGTSFTLAANGAVVLPDWLKADQITIGSTAYQMGIGGLHSCEKRRAVFCAADEMLSDFDVASYYPAIILQQRLAPKSMGAPFLKIYQSIVQRRVAAKRAGDTVTANTLKIAVNGSFGKLGSKWSPLYAPDLLIQTTLTGQLCLLMLIESLELAGVSVISANTDGIVVHTKASNEQRVDEICFDWMMSTSFALERTDYRALASRDVNNYVAVKPDGTYKGKGIFSETGLMKNPDFPIVYRAVAEHVAAGINPRSVIMASQDLREFVSLRKVTGGATWRGETLGKAVRFYYSTAVAHDECIHYANNSNRVPKSASGKPVMVLPDLLPDDIDYLQYIEAAEKLCCEIGL